MCSGCASVGGGHRTRKGSGSTASARRLPARRARLVAPAGHALSSVVDAPAASGSSCPPTTRRRTSRRSCAPRRRSSSAPCPATGACSWWTTPPPTAPARSPTGWPPSCPGSRCCTARARRGSGKAYLAGFALRARARRRARDRHGRRLLARPGAPARPDRRGRDQRPGAGLALRGRRQDRGLAAAAPRAQPRRLALRPDRSSASRCATSPRGFRCVRRERARDDRALDAALPGLRLQHRAHLPGRCWRASA